MNDRGSRLLAYMNGPSAIPGLKGMDVLAGTKGLAKHGHSIYPLDDGAEDARLHEPALHARVKHWLGAGLSQRELKQKAKEEGLEISGNKKVLALRLAFKGLPAGLPSPVFASGGGTSAGVSAPDRDTCGGADLDSRFQGAAGGEAAGESNGDEEDYEVERILDEKPGKFLVKWKGYPQAEATWEDVAACDGCMHLVADFRKAQAQAAGAAGAAAAAAAAAPAAAQQVFTAPAAAPTVSAAAAAATSAPVAHAAEEEEADDEELYDDWVPRTASGSQKSCNVIRGEITRFLARGTMTQTAFLQKIR